MRTWTLLLAIAVAPATWASPQGRQEAEALQAGRQAERAGDLAAARQIYADAHALAQRQGDPRAQAEALEARARLESSLRHDELAALPFWEEADAIRRAASLAGSEDGVRTARHLQSVYSKQQRWAKVEALERRLLARAETAQKDRERVYALANLARTIERARPGDPEAEALLQRSRRMAAAIGDQASRRSALQAEASFLSNRGRAAEAVERWLELLALPYASEPSERAHLLGALADDYWRQEALDLAEIHLRESIEQSELAYGPEHPLLQGRLRSLARLLGVQGRTDEAAGVLERALSISRRDTGDRSAHTRQLEESLGRAREAEGEPVDLLGTCPVCACAKPPPEIERLREEGRFQDALDAARKGLRQAEATHGADALPVAEALGVVAQLVRSLDAGDALALERRRAEILQARLGLASPRVAEAAAEWASAAWSADREDELIAARELAVAAHQASGTITFQLARALYSLGAAYTRVDRWDDAEATYELAHDVIVATAGPSAPEAWSSRSALANAHRRAGRLVPAEMVLREMVQDLEKQPQATRRWHRDLYGALSALHGVLWKQGRTAEAKALESRRDQAQKAAYED